MWFWIIAQPPFFFSRASSCLGTWLRIWSNSSQVEEKNGSFASLLNGTRPETSKVRTRTFWEQKTKSIVFSSPLCGRMGAWFMVQLVFLFSSNRYVVVGCWGSNRTGCVRVAATSVGPAGCPVPNQLRRHSDQKLVTTLLQVGRVFGSKLQSTHC